MGKRGKKPYEDSGDGLMPMSIIAKRLGVSERTVRYDWKKAQEKLKEDPGSFSILLECVHGVAASERELMQCSSVECNQEYIEKFGE